LSFFFCCCWGFRSWRITWSRPRRLLLVKILTRFRIFSSSIFKLYQRQRLDDYPSLLKFSSSRRFFFLFLFFWVTFPLLQRHGTTFLFPRACSSFPPFCRNSYFPLSGCVTSTLPPPGPRATTSRFYHFFWFWERLNPQVFFGPEKGPPPLPFGQKVKAALTGTDLGAPPNLSPT